MLERKIERERTVDRFFEDCFNQIFLQPKKSLFAIDGPIGTGKTSEFVVRSAYKLACMVPPIEIGGAKVRESLWLSLANSEENARLRLANVFKNAIFSAEILNVDDNILTLRNQHPVEMHISHGLSDGTFLHMIIECRGTYTEEDCEKIKSLEYVGAIIPEMQTVPWRAVTTAIERAGRWNTKRIKIKHIIDGKEYTLSGQEQLAVVLADLNIPPRGPKSRELYEKWYDNPNRGYDSESERFIFFTPPSPILPKSIDDVPNYRELKDKYPVTTYEGKRVIWLPNPKAYNFTRQFEREDTEGNPVPWSGYGYWFGQLHKTESEIRREVIGLPDNLSGESAVYKTFRQDDQTVKDLPLTDGRIFIGYDPGGHSAFIFLQEQGEMIYAFKEFIFGIEDSLSTRSQIKDYVIPYCEKYLAGREIFIVPDPASVWLGKSVMSDVTESAINVLRLSINESGKSCKYKIEFPKVRNQEVDVRISSLKYFVEQNKIVIHPECKTFIHGLMGGYHYKSTRTNVISDMIDKTESSCDVVEAAQYVCVNLLFEINRKMKNGKRDTIQRISKLRIK